MELNTTFASNEAHCSPVCWISHPENEASLDQLVNDAGDASCANAKGTGQLRHPNARMMDHLRKRPSSTRSDGERLKALHES
jgi:hypothetical protein